MVHEDHSDCSPGQDEDDTHEKRSCIVSRVHWLVVSLVGALTMVRQKASLKFKSIGPCPLLCNLEIGPISLQYGMLLGVRCNFHAAYYTH